MCANANLGGQVPTLASMILLGSGLLVRVGWRRFRKSQAKAGAAAG